MAAHENLSDLVDLFKKVEVDGYVLLPDDYTALGYLAMGVNDYNRMLFVVGQANMALEFLDTPAKWLRYHMCKNEDGSYGIR